MQRPEHAVLVHIKLSNDDFGTSSDQEVTGRLEEQLIHALESSDCGEFDGVESGQGEVVFYMYGADADVLFANVWPVLRASLVARNGYVVKRYGGPGSPTVRAEL
jgi:hypothetical protein